MQKPIKEYKQETDNAWSQTATSNKKPTLKLGQDCQTQHSIIRPAPNTTSSGQQEQQTWSKPREQETAKAHKQQTKNIQ